ncbi:MAG: hypothetical protein IJD33_03550, partial [Clostridia bacterium]|nr:hypothetical protein [Clostridia bacterium]
MKKLKIFAAILFMICTFGGLFSLTGCDKYELATPVIIGVDLEHQLTWNEVEAARRYEIEIQNENGEVV